MAKEIINGFDQITLAGGGPMISYGGGSGRGSHPPHWAVLYYRADGAKMATYVKKHAEDKAPWYQYDEEWFDLYGYSGSTHAEAKKAALAAAQEWAGKRFKVTEWARNKMGQYVPADINKKFPIRGNPRTSRGPKVYHWLDHTHIVWSEKPYQRQVDCLVYAKSKAEVARLAGVDRPSQLFNLTDTGNDEDIARAMAKPGVILWRHLDDRNGEWKEGRPSGG